VSGGSAPDGAGPSFAETRRTMIVWSMWLFAIFYYYFLITNGSFDPFGVEALGRLYNDMALRLLRGDFTIDPSIAEGEAWVRDGKTYVYYGIGPALLRMPLALVIPLQTVSLARLSCWTALAIASWAQVSVMLRAARSVPATGWHLAMFITVMVAMLFTGPQLAATFAAWVFNEPIYWSEAFVALFLRLAFIRLLDRRRVSAGDWAWLGLLTGMTICTRPPEGLALVAGACALGLADAWRMRHAGEHLIPALLRRLVESSWAYVLCALPFLALAGYVNEQRWGNPLTFADGRYYVHAMDSPDIYRIYTSEPMFSVMRIPYAVAYYLFGFMGNDAIHAYLVQYFGAPGGGWPRSVLLATATCLGALALFGIGATLRDSSERRLSIALVAPAVLVLLMLMVPFLNFRYRYEFVPLLALGAALAVRRIGNWNIATVRKAAMAAMLLTLVNVATSHLDLLQAKLASFAYSDDERRSIIEHTAPFSELFAPRQ
jgi:hypothetical protein